MFVTSRCDDVINVAGHRISTGAIEEVRIITFFISHYRNMHTCISYVL